MKITKDAQQRIYGESLHDQLAKHRKDLVIAQAHNELQGKLIERRRKSQLEQDQADITLGLQADQSWSGQHARLTLPLDGAE